MEAAVIYWSRTGNTAKAATAIKEGPEAASLIRRLQGHDQAQEGAIPDETASRESA